MVDRLTGICVCASFAVKKFSILHLEKAFNCQDFFVVSGAVKNIKS